MSSNRVLVAGASGRTGREVVKLLLGTDYVVRALTSNPEKKSTLSDIGADEVVIGDLLSPSDCRRVVEGVDAIVCTVGSTPGTAFRADELVDGTGVINLVDAATDEGVERFVLESSIGVGTSRDGMPRPLRFLLNTAGVIDAKENGEAHLRQSGLAYTIVRPGGLTDDPATGRVLVGEGGKTVGGSIPRADVARVMVAALATPESENRTFEVVSRNGLRGEPRGVVQFDWAFPEGTTAH